MVFSLIALAAALKAGISLVSAGLWFMPVLMASLAYFHYDVHDPESHPINQKQLRKQYDFIVVGGGSAGAVLANRLSEIPHWTVLLLEAGPDENEISDVPSLSAYLQLSKLDWQYKTEPTGAHALARWNNIKRTLYS